MPSEEHRIDPTQLAQITDLELLARIVVDGFMTGLHRSPRFGTSIEFAQYRAYTQGDDPRFIDWSLYARTDRLHTKLFQDDTNLRCTIMIDCSASMNYASGAVSKFQYARMLAACLALLLFRQKDGIGLIGFQESAELYLPPRNSARHLRRLQVELNSLQAKGKTDISRALEYAGDVSPPRGMLILISDLLHPVESTIAPLRLMRARNHDAIVFQISDPSEQTFPFKKSVTLLDAESDREQFVVPDSIREEYLENRERHFSQIRNECLAVEIDVDEFVTDEPLDRALHAFLQRRTQTLSSGQARRNQSVMGGFG